MSATLPGIYEHVLMWAASSVVSLQIISTIGLASKLQITYSSASSFVFLDRVKKTVSAEVHKLLPISN